MNNDVICITATWLTYGVSGPSVGDRLAPVEMVTDAGHLYYRFQEYPEHEYRTCCFIEAPIIFQVEELERVDPYNCRCIISRTE